MLRRGIDGSRSPGRTGRGKGRPGYGEKPRLTPDEAITLARRSGGVCVLAHPLTMALDPPALDGAVGELAELGLVGLEAIYGRYQPEERAGLTELAARHG